MKNFLRRILLLLFTISSLPALAQSGTCSNDSTIITFTLLFNDNGTEYGIVYDTYDRDSGLVTRCSQTATNGAAWTSIACSPATVYEHLDTIHNTSGGVEELLWKTGSASGWTNARSNTFTYTASGLVATETHRSWNGASWDSTFQQTWLYDVQDRLIETDTYTYASGLRLKQSRIDIAWSGSTPLSKTFLSGSYGGTVWKNDSQFVFGYTNSLRTSADISNWDSTSASWATSVQLLYQQHLSNWCIRFFHSTPHILQGITVNDSVYWDLDTLESVVYRRNVSVTSVDTTSYFYIIAQVNDYEYVRIQNQVLLLNSFDAECSSNPPLGDTAYTPIDRPYRSAYVYDSLGHVLTITNTGGCTNPCGTDISYAYDSTGFMTNYNYYHWTMVSETYYNCFYSHYDTSSVSLLIPPWDVTVPLCQGVTYQPNLVAAGGCPPYFVHWFPSTGLSSDTVFNPEISVLDSTDYTVVVSDNAGHRDTIIYSIGPLFSTALTIDTGTCSGPWVLSVENAPDTYYQWYANSIVLPAETLAVLNVTQAGDYCVRISRYQGNYCIQYSDTISVPVFPTLDSTYAVSLCYGDSVLLPDGSYENQTGAYQSVITSASGCDSTITTNLTVGVELLPSIVQSGDTLFSTLPATTYTWTFNGSFYATDTIPYIVITQSGLYDLTITDSSGCTGVSAPFNGIIDATGAINSSGSIRIYPNPSHNLLNFEMAEQQVPARIELSDLSGKELRSLEITSSYSQISLSGISAGTYFLTVQSEHSRTYYRILIE